MNTRHYPHWPKGLPYSVDVPATSVFENLAVSARRFPDKAAIVYYGRALSYAGLHEDSLALAGFLQRECGTRVGEPVMVCLANSPQFVIAYYAALRAEGIAVPVNPMSRREELRHIARDSGARVIVAAQDAVDDVLPLLDDPACALETFIVVAYAEYAGAARVAGATGGTRAGLSRDAAPPSGHDIEKEAEGEGDYPAYVRCEVPEVVRAPRVGIEARGCVAWRAALDAGAAPRPHRATAASHALLPYSSGTTGAPKGCLHTHRGVNSVIAAYMNWFPYVPGASVLATLPLFHVAGMQNSMNVPIYAGCTMHLMTRWDRTLALELIQSERISIWRSITAMAIDFFGAEEVERFDLSSLVAIGGGGTTVPRAVAERMEALVGLPYVEGFGMSETISATHINPPARSKPQCLGVPLFDVDSRVLDIDSGVELGPNEVGEIVVRGPQVFEGYWGRPEATAEAFVEHEGLRFLRTGDLGYMDADGYFYLVDRAKRMINAAGFKVWPAEVEALMHAHPGVREACVIATRDARRGESAKAVVIRDDAALDEAALIAWCRDTMAAYKVPRAVEFVDDLPRTGVGKVLWRELQAREDAATDALARD